MAELILGAVLAAAAIAAVRAVRPSWERAVWAWSLVGAALVYPALALRVEPGWELAIEAVGLVVFGTLALMGILLSPRILALGWAAHAVWDLLTPHLIDTGFIPIWYVLACIGFDVVVAAHLFVRAGEIAGAGRAATALPASEHPIG